MAYQCNVCNAWTADGNKHECIYDKYNILEKKYKTLCDAVYNLFGGYNGTNWPGDDEVIELMEMMKNLEKNNGNAKS